jgi:Cys-tRNA(Pro)/Cys-tRNA(Cys) deacylase
MAPTPAAVALDRAGITYTLHSYDHDPSVASYGEEAAEVLGVEPGRVFKTLVATTGTELVVGVVPVVATLDLRALASAVGAKRTEMADAAAAERSSGYVLGGISPIGQRKRLTTVIDATAEQWTTVYCSGGRRGLEIELAPADLVRVTGGRVAPIARSS